jgi:hypothetical protein
MSKELDELMETLTTERSILELKQVVLGTPIIRAKGTPSRFVNGCVDISQFQTRGPLVQESQYRQQHRQQGRK